VANWLERSVKYLFSPLIRLLSVNGHQDFTNSPLPCLRQFYNPLILLKKLFSKKIRNAIDNRAKGARTNREHIINA